VVCENFFWISNYKSFWTGFFDNNDLLSGKDLKPGPAVEDKLVESLDTIGT